MSTFSNKERLSECDKLRLELLGKVILDDHEESALDAGEYIRKKDLPSPNRVLLPNSRRTMDYRPDRLNITVDHTMRVTNIQFG